MAKKKIAAKPKLKPAGPPAFGKGKAKGAPMPPAPMPMPGAMPWKKGAC